MLHGAADGLLDAVIWSDALLITLQHAAPAQIIRQITGGHAMKASHPAFQSAVVGIDVLDMESALAYPLAGARMHDVMGDALCPGKVGIHRSPITAKHRLRVDQRQKGFPDMFAIELGQLEVSGVPLSVAHNHHGDLVFTRAAGHADSTAFTRLPR